MANDNITQSRSSSGQAQSEARSTRPRPLARLHCHISQAPIGHVGPCTLETTRQGLQNSLLQWKQWTQQSNILSNPEASGGIREGAPAHCACIPTPSSPTAAVTMAALMANRVLVNNKVSGISHMRCPAGAGCASRAAQLRAPAAAFSQHCIAQSRIWWMRREAIGGGAGDAAAYLHPSQNLLGSFMRRRRCG
jgi:hypothetical protein